MGPKHFSQRVGGQNPEIAFSSFSRVIVGETFGIDSTKIKLQVIELLRDGVITMELFGSIDSFQEEFLSPFSLHAIEFKPSSSPVGMH